MKIPINVKRDHIEALISTKRPIAALIELVWNGLDADATTISIRFDKNTMEGLSAIRVQDNGSGIPYEKANDFFGSLGGSWKSQKHKTPNGRNLHGKSGKGRFKAFALGTLVEWNTTSKQNEKFVDYKIIGTSTDLETFEVTDTTPSRNSNTGTEVTISNIDSDFSNLTGEQAPIEIAKYLAVYLSEYPGIIIDYDGTQVDPRAAQERIENVSLQEILLSNGKKISPKLTIIEWKQKEDRILHLCESKGISLHQVPITLKAPGYNFSAYLKTDYFKELDKTGQLDMEELNPDVQALIKAANDEMKRYFRRRSAEDTASLVQTWKEEKIYPYEGAPLDKVEEAERQVFDVVAINLNDYLQDFNESAPTNKKFTFNLIKQALRSNPESLQRIFEDVLKLPKDQQNDLAELLEKTTLPAIIRSAKIVANRLDFLKGLEQLIFGKESKQKLLERDQLHKILEKETWLFGENFHLTITDSSLDEVLKKHLEKLGERNDPKQGPVLREDGTSGRIDLMLARSIPQSNPQEQEYLVVELKRPSKKIDTEVLGQIKSYAFAVAQDERFRDTKTRWVFWAVSNEITNDARREARQQGKPEGMVHDDSEQRLTIWAKSWGQIIQEAKARHEYFHQQLEYEADHASARAYLEKTHKKYLPKVADVLSEELVKI